MVLVLSMGKHDDCASVPPVLLESVENLAMLSPSNAAGLPPASAVSVPVVLGVSVQPAGGALVSASNEPLAMRLKPLNAAVAVARKAPSGSRVTLPTKTL